MPRARAEPIRVQSWRMTQAFGQGEELLTCEFEADDIDPLVRPGALVLPEPTALFRIDGYDLKGRAFLVERIEVESEHHVYLGRRGDDAFIDRPMRVRITARPLGLTRLELEAAPTLDAALRGLAERMETFRSYDDAVDACAMYPEVFQPTKPPPKAKQSKPLKQPPASRLELITGDWLAHA